MFHSPASPPRNLASALLRAAALVVFLSLPQSRLLGAANPSGPIPHRVLPPGGEAAIASLGGNLPTVAKAHGLLAAELAEEFRRDANLRVDPSGALHFVDQPLVEEGPLAEAASQPLALDYPLSSTFQLHSRPGASRTIYLDFDGHLLSKTAWNAAYTGGADLLAPPFDTDGQPGSFSDGELAVIQEVWRRVSEDFQPFDVDVTTELTSETLLTRSTSSDGVFGVRVLVSAISSSIMSAGGASYVGTFDDLGDYYKPCLVFPEKLRFNAKYIGEACSHEAGHSLGLRHDGTTTGTVYYAGHGSGETSWAPIMGNGYYCNVTQWSRGEYANANNKEDDLAVMQSYGLPPASDDVGDALDTASPLPLGPSLSFSGVLGLGNDVDVFAFSSGTGSATLTLRPFRAGPNLDLGAEILDGSGTVLASASPAGVLGVSFSLSLEAGTYFLRLHGTGQGDPLTTGYSAYDSGGLYTIEASVPNPSASIPPVAMATASPSSGVAPLAVTVDGSGSFDPDGTIADFSWSFPDGTLRTGPTATVSFLNAGRREIQLTVRDNDGNLAQTSVVVDVLAPNQPPQAEFSLSPSSGTTPLQVTMDGSASSDPDGAIASHLWNFGDGTPEASGPKAWHTYTSPGTYTVTLTVTDTAGATATQQSQVVVQGSPFTTLRVTSMAISAEPVSSGTIGTVSVLVTNLQGTPVGGVVVAGVWSGITSTDSTATTASDGTAVMTIKRGRKTGTLSYSVTNLSKPGYLYDASENLINSVTVSVTAKR